MALKIKQKNPKINGKFSGFIYLFLNPEINQKLNGKNKWFYEEELQNKILQR